MRSHLFAAADAAFGGSLRRRIISQNPPSYAKLAFAGIIDQSELELRVFLYLSRSLR
jgi:hypothetical protein